MTYKLVDLYRNKVLGIYDTAEQAAKAESHMVHELGETRYAIEAPEVKKPRARKTRVKKESD